MLRLAFDLPTDRWCRRHCPRAKIRSRCQWRWRPSWPRSCLSSSLSFSRRSCCRTLLSLVRFANNNCNCWRFRVFFVPGVVTDRDQTHSPSCDLRNAIALIAYTYREGLIWQHIQPNRTVESVVNSSICPEGQIESQSSSTTQMRFEPALWGD